MVPNGTKQRLAFGSNIVQYIDKEERRKEKLQGLFLRTTGSEEAQAPARLAFRYHAAALARVEGLQEPHHLVHVRPFVRVRVPALAHDVRHRARAAAGDVRAKILRRQTITHSFWPPNVCSIRLFKKENMFNTWNSETAIGSESRQLKTNLMNNSR